VERLFSVKGGGDKYNRGILTGARGDQPLSFLNLVDGNIS